MGRARYLRVASEAGAAPHRANGRRQPRAKESGREGLSLWRQAASPTPPLEVAPPPSAGGMGGARAAASRACSRPVYTGEFARCDDDKGGRRGGVGDAIRRRPARLGAARP